MRTDTITALFIEDNPGDVALVRESLGGEEGRGITLEYADRLSAGLERLESGGIDIVLLDLNLPDSSGLSTLERLRAAAPSMPVVVLTGLDNPEAGSQAVKQGAQDYVTKNRLDSFLLAHSIRFAVLRHEVDAEVEKVQEEFQAGASRGPADQPAEAGIPLDKHSLGLGTLGEAARAPLVRRLGAVLDGAVSSHAQRSDAKTSAGLRALADELGRAGACPRDVLEMYTSCIEEKLSGSSARERRAYGQRGPWVLVELLAHLLLHYLR